jgi:hypothetical protein
VERQDLADRAQVLATDIIGRKKACIKRSYTDRWNSLALQFPDHFAQHGLTGGVDFIDPLGHQQDRGPSGIFGTGGQQGFLKVRRVGKNQAPIEPNRKDLGVGRQSMPVDIAQSPIRMTPQNRHMGPHHADNLKVHGQRNTDQNTCGNLRGQKYGCPKSHRRHHPIPPIDPANPRKSLEIKQAPDRHNDHGTQNRPRQIVKPGRE